MVSWSYFGLLKSSIGFFRIINLGPNAQFITVLLLAVSLVYGAELVDPSSTREQGTSPSGQTVDSAQTSSQSKENQSAETTARIMANGDLLTIFLSTEQL